MPIFRHLPRLILALLALLLITCIALWNMDLGRFQSSIEAFASEALGRELRVETLSVQLGSELTFSGSGLHIANPDWAEDPALLSVEQFSGSLVLSSLWREGPLLLNRLELQEIRLALEWREDGSNNLAPPAAASSTRADAIGLPLLIRSARMGDFQGVLRDPARDFPIAVQLLGLSLTTDAQAMLRLEMQGSLNQQDLAYRGTVGPFEELLEAGEIRFQGDGRIGSLQISGTGVIDHLTAPDRPQLDLRLQGSDLRMLETLLGFKSPPEAQQQPYDLQLTSSTQEQDWQASLKGALGRLDMTLALRSSGLQELNQLSLTADVKGPSARALLRLAGVDLPEDSAFTLQGAVNRDGPLLAIDSLQMALGGNELTLNGELHQFPKMHDGRLQLELAGPQLATLRPFLKLPPLFRGPYRLHGTLAPQASGAGALDLTLESEPGIIRAVGTISETERYLGSELQLDIEGHDVNTLATLLKLPPLSPSAFTLRGDLRAEQNGIRVSAAQLTGLQGARLTVEGLLASPVTSQSTALQLELSGANFAHTLAPFVDGWQPRQVPFQFRATLAGAGQGFTLVDPQLRVAEATLNSRGVLPLQQSLAGLNLSLDAEGPDLQQLLHSTLDYEVPAGAWRLAARVRRSNGLLTIDRLDMDLDAARVAGTVVLPWPVRMEQAQFQLEARGPDLSQTLPRLGDFRFAAQKFNLQLDASVQQGAWTIKRSDLLLGQAQLRLRGLAADPGQGANGDFHLGLTVPSLAALGTWDKEPLPAEAVQLDGTFTLRPGSFTFKPLTLKVAQSTVSGSALVDWSDGLPLLTLALDSEQLDLRPFMLEDPGAPEPAGAADDGRLIPDLPLPLTALRQFNADLDLNFASLETPRRILSDVLLQATLRDGALRLDRLRSGGLMGNFEVQGSLQPVSEQSAKLTLDVSARKLTPNRADWHQADPATLPQFNGEARLQASGAGLRELAAGLNGRLVLTAEPGVFPGKGLGALNYSFLEQVFNAIIPGLKIREATELKCFAADLRIEDGLLSTMPLIALQTTKLLILSSGTLNLEDERLSFGFQATPTRLLNAQLTELLNPFVRIEGSLAQPTPVIDPKGTLIYGSAAAATAGLSIVAKGLWDRLRGSTRPCQRLYKSLTENPPIPSQG